MKSNLQSNQSIHYPAAREKLHRQALVLEGLSHGFEDEPLFSIGDLILEAGAKLAVIGENGVGKTTFLRCLMKQIEANSGGIKWSENASIAYCPTGQY